MKYLTLLALLPVLATSAHAQRATQAPAELLPWDNFVRETVLPEAAVKLLTTLHIGSRIDTFHIPLSNCGNDVQSVNLKIQGANVTVQTFGLRFNDGATRDFNVNKVFNAGTESGWIDLGIFRSMDQRCPVDVYAKGNATGNATVLVYGNMK